MKYSNPIEEDGLSEMMNRICGTTNSVYSNKAKVVDINNAIDKYFTLGNYQFEDSNQSTAPIETINLVSGTSRYALGDLTSELLNFLRVEITDASGLDILIYPNRLSNINEAYNEYYKDNATPAEYFKIGKYIDLKPAPNYSATAGLKIYFDRPASKYTFQTITSISNGASALVTCPAVHGLAINDTVIFETDGGLPTGLTADTVVYYVITAGFTTLAFQVSTTLGATAVTTSSAGSGNHKLLKVSRTPGIPSIHHPYLARKAALEFLGYKKLAQFASVSQQVALDERDIKEYFNQRNKDERHIMTTAGINFR